MKRVIILLTCFSVFYAGVLWALEGCRDLGVGFDAHHDAEIALSSHHEGADTSSHHSHSDQTQIHCPNILGEFVLSSRVSLNADRSVAVHADHPGQQIDYSILSVAAVGFGAGPPRPNLSPTFPRHLFLSVLQI
jgi:hypothetical protein